MAAAKANYIILYKTSAQVYAATNLATALKTPLPKGCSMEDRIIMFMSYLPDEESLCVYLLGEEQLNEENEKIALQKLKEQEAEWIKAAAAEEQKDEEEQDVEIY
jgi:hypothetical protein